MKKLFVFAMMISGMVQAQKMEFNVSVSSDTLLLGNYLEVKFEVNNGKGRFMAPDFQGWTVVSGPNTSSSFSIINGDVKQSSSYSYYLEAGFEGVYTILPAQLETDDGVLKTPEIQIIVLPNPEGIRQHPKNREESKYFMDEAPVKTPAKKKRKAVKI
ncbi:MAG: BatD family protein [Saprospiraceae bacterium]|nr:BatD family protein [Saprospiraceae bacterium]